MPRFKDANWDIATSPFNPTTAADADNAQLAVLMDIRDELKGIRRRLDCPDTLNIPMHLANIVKNTKPKRKYRRKKIAT